MNTETGGPIREFHISRKARDRYHFDDSLFTLNGNVIFTNFFAARNFTYKINERKDLVNYPEQAIKTSQLIAMGLIDEILHFVVSAYRDEAGSKTLADAVSYVADKVGEKALEKTLRRFSDEFPPLAVYKRSIDIDTYLNGETGGIGNREITLEEMLLLWLANMNPAFSPFFELFEDSDLKRDTVYLQIISHLRSYFEHHPPFGPQRENLIDMLRSPAIAVPHSLSGQLEYIMEHWGYLLGRFFTRMLRSLDLFKEEEKIPFLGPGPAQVYRFAGLEFESEKFSPDRDWMPRLVVMAKNIYVWLDQLSKKYQRHIATLAEIPDAELVTLQRSGFSGLWLIGIWERSPASQRIKQMCGNPEAVPSAYSLYDYQIAEDLGGESAFLDLKERTWGLGIRLASDMVPNHVGIYSRWTIEHPDWFIALDHNPYPWYSFNGPDLSQDERVSIQIEDHYYDRTDAAVVFKRTDRWTGSEQYVYHGNDGTSMPWNDTAQLNYLNPEVREAMIRTILHVARQFPVIRFDAAMTLTKKHFQRLWFPEPGTGGAIPTRVEHSITREEFDRMVPHEFWREVVDRIAAEAPDTLLLAEAFWLLEGYFVRTLGMHRVYNSAFMNMLRDEENAKYRSVMKNTLEFDPEILKRFVNFMNNPDERTAVDQFGKDDKYFGTCMMMVTLPGLPMFGHGQIEGYAEKYGMEYRRAYWDEMPDQYLIERHEREIFPLLHKRHLFAGVDHFLLYDFFTPEGHVNEDVFAYSNRYGNDRSLVIFNNKLNSARGWIKTSVAFSAKEGGSNARSLIQRTLADGLSFDHSDNSFLIFRDYIHNLQYIRSHIDIIEKGLYVEVEGYKYHTFLDFMEVRDDEQHRYRRITEYLNGRGVPSIDDALEELFLQPIHRRFEAIVNTDNFARLILAAQGPVEENLAATAIETLVKESENGLIDFFREVKGFTSGMGDELAIARDVGNTLRIILSFRQDHPVRTPNAGAIGTITDIIPGAAHFGWLFVHSLGRVGKAGQEGHEQSRSWIDEWNLDRMLRGTFLALGMSDKEIWEDIALIKVFTTHQGWYEKERGLTVYQTMEAFFNDADVRLLLQINRYKDLLWFNKETFEVFLSWMFFTGAVTVMQQHRAEKEVHDSALEELIGTITSLHNASIQSQYQLSRFMELVKGTG